MSFYETDDNAYCYPGTTVLRNLRNLRSQRALTRFETAMTAQRFDEPLPNGRLSVRHFRAVHHHLFQDVYAWAGKSRTVRIGKEGSAFCYPEYIDGQLKRTFNGLRRKDFLRALPAADFVQHAAEFLSELNAIHAFRDGNGRSQIAFMALVATRPDIPSNWNGSGPGAFYRPWSGAFTGISRL